MLKGLFRIFNLINRKALYARGYGSIGLGGGAVVSCDEETRMNPFNQNRTKPTSSC